MNKLLPGFGRPTLLSSSNAHGAGIAAVPAPEPRTRSMREEWRDPAFRSDCIIAIIVLLIVLLGATLAR